MRSQINPCPDRSLSCLLSDCQIHSGVARNNPCVILMAESNKKHAPTELLQGDVKGGPLWCVTKEDDVVSKNQ